MDGGVTGEEVDAPTESFVSADVTVLLEKVDLRERCRGSLMTGDQERHHLVDKFFVFKATGFQRHRDDIDTIKLLFFHCLTLTSDEVPASLLDETVRFDDFLIALVTI